MLHILWIIIKFILILLGIILGLILAVLLLVLFCPFRYYASAEKQNEDFKKTKLYVSFSWLFYGVWVRLHFQEGVLGTKINIFGIPIHKLMERKKKKESEPQDSLSFEDDEDLFEEAFEDISAIEEKKAENVTEEIVKEPQIKEISEEKTEVLTEDTEEVQQEMQKDNAVSVLEKIRNILDGISKKLKSIGEAGSMAEKVSEKISTVKTKVQGILDKINWWKCFVTHPKVKGAVVCAKRAVFRILKHIIPTRIYGEVTFGSEDPATTGTVLAVMGITMPFHKNNVKITPLYEGKNILTGKIQLKGRIYIFILLIQVLKVLINKNVRYTIKYWKNKEELKNGA